MLRELRTAGSLFSHYGRIIRQDQSEPLIVSARKLHFRQFLDMLICGAPLQIAAFLGLVIEFVAYHKPLHSRDGCTLFSAYALRSFSC